MGHLKLAPSLSRWLLLQCSLWPTVFWSAFGFDINRNDNLAVYWGQDSSGKQQRLSFYCQDDVYDMIPMAFLYVFFGIGGEPMIDFANICSTEANGVFPGTQLANCSFLGQDIEDCQSKGKVVTISLGGATGDVGFTNASQAKDFADTIWNQFLGGSSDIRPFGDAVLDGVDLDIEGGLPSFYSDFVDQLRTHTDSAKKQYYITAAPQCPLPDANLGQVLNASRFDAVYIQFYNNYCGLNAPDQFDFSVWDEWARTQSPNRDVKLFIGAPGSATAAGQGFVNIAQLQQYAMDAQQTYDTFGGVMLWDASDAYDNNRYDKAIKTSMSANGREVSNPTSGSGGNTTGGTSPTFPGSNGPGPSGSTCLVQQPLGMELLWTGGQIRTSTDIRALFTTQGVRVVMHQSREVLKSFGRIARRRVSSLVLGGSSSAVVRPKYRLHRRMTSL